MQTPWHKARGSITLVALTLAVVIGISLASYLTLCQQTLTLSTRTVQMSKARQLAETGLEEALWALNNGIWNKAGPNSDVVWTGTITTNESCSLPGPSMPAGYALGGNATGTLTITINFTAPNSINTPKITSVAEVTVPGLGKFTKTLTAETKPAPLFANAIGVINGNVTLPASTVIDSWNSDPDKDYNISTAAVAYSFTAGTASNHAAVVAAPTVTMNGNATIYGYAATLGNPINNPSANGVIKGPASPATPKIDSARVSKSAFIPAFTVAAPSPVTTSTWTTLPSYASWGSIQTIGSSPGPTQFRYVTGNLLLDGTRKLKIDGPVVLVIEKDLALKDSGQIQITTQGRLEIYVRDDVDVSDNAGLENLTNEPKNLALFCTSQYSGSTNFSYSSTATFNGVIYSNDNNEGMSFSSSPEMHGAILAGFTPSFTAAGLKIHYDAALQYLPKDWFRYVTTPFMITQLTETP